MPPKARSKAKKGKPLTRGRPKRHISVSPNDSDTEDNQSEGVPMSSSEIENEVPSSAVSSVSAASSVSRSKKGKGTAKTKKPTKEPSTEEEEVAGSEGEGESELFRNLPDMVAELRGKTGAVVTYVTKDTAHRQFELNVRRELLQAYNHLDIVSDSLKTSLNLTRKMCTDARNGTTSEAIKSVGCPMTFTDLIARLMAAQPTTPLAHPLRHEVLLEESEEDLQMETDPGYVATTPFGSKAPRTVFPSPAKMSKYTTPVHNNGVFRFGEQSNRKGIPSTNKAPRLPKPGEVAFSESGSPLLQRRIQDDLSLSARALEHVELIGDDGSKIEFDMVYRGAQDVNKVRGFKEFARDVRGMASTRSTVKQNRVQAPRVKAGSQSSSASKSKPGWR